ncbi:MAG: MBL fold metallo-hydrolase [Syntrophobacteraceae bacterium]
MNEVAVRFLGSGDAFGSGGRLQTCIHLQLDGKDFLIDFGASSLIAMKHWGVDPSRIDAILLTHLHGDHFGGIPFLFLHEQLISKRSAPILIAGPPGLEERIIAAMEVFFPGSSKMKRGFSVEFVELTERTQTQIGNLKVTPFLVTHASGAPSYALRIECGKIVGYSGDTEWTDALTEVAQDADLFICEAYYWEKQVKYHLDYRTLMEHKARLGCRRLILTHMSEDILARLAEVEPEYARDGLRILL